MELNAIKQLERSGRTVRTREAKTDGSETVGSAASNIKRKTDSIDLAERAVTELKEQNQRLMNLLRQDRETEKLPALWETEDGTESGSGMLDALEEGMKAMLRCQKIAARIMRGDKVPPQDEQYLMKNDPNGYKLAMAMRTPKRKPKKWESVLKDDEKKAAGDSNNGDSQETASQVSESASESGGDAASDSGE